MSGHGLTGSLMDGGKREECDGARHGDSTGPGMRAGVCDVGLSLQQTIEAMCLSRLLYDESDSCAYVV